MPLLTYTDAYLAAQCTDDREYRAGVDVDDIAAFAAKWRDKLVVLRTYIIACLECQGDADDLFAQKLKHYQREFDRVLVLAKSDTQDASGQPLSVFSVPLERG
jgi:hypothetical protein